MGAFVPSILSTIQPLSTVMAILMMATTSSAQFGIGPGKAAEVSSPQEQAPRRVTSYPAPSKAEAKILRSLTLPTSTEWKDLALKEALDSLEVQHEIEIWIDVRALNDVGISIDQQVTLTAKEISLRSCLRLILEPMGLIYVIEDDVLKVTTPDRLSQRVVTGSIRSVICVATLMKPNNCWKQSSVDLGKPMTTVPQPRS